MCYNPETSITTFILVSGICLLLWNRNHPYDRALSIILLSVVSMQLLEFFLWTNLDCGPVNMFFTNLIPVVLVLQPVLMLFAVGVYKAGWAVGYKDLAIVIGLLGLVAIVQILQKGLPCTRVGEKGHLEWPTASYFDRFWFAPFYYFGTTYALATLKNIPLAVGFIGSTAVSHLYYNLTAGKQWPSLWCHFCNALAVLALVLN